MKRNIFTLFYTILFIFLGLALPLQAQTGGPTDLEKLQGAIESFLLEKGDIGDGNGEIENWERLELEESPDDNPDWWTEFEEKGFYNASYKGLTLTNTSYIESYPICYGKLLLEDIEGLEYLELYTDHLTEITISNCSNLGNLYFARSYGSWEDIDSNNTKTSVSIINCQNLEYLGQSLEFISLADIEISECPKVTSININTIKGIDDITVKDLANFISFHIYNDGSEVNSITLENNSYTSYSMYDSFYFSSNATLKTFPQLPTSILSLNINYDNPTDFPGSIDLENLENLKTITFSGLSVLPKLPASIENIECYGYNNNTRKLTGEIDLDGFSKLDRLDCSGNDITAISNIPSSLTTLYCSENKIDELSGLPESLLYLSCSDNLLSGELDLSNLDKLVELYCNNNKLTDIKLHDSRNKDNISISTNWNFLPFSVIENLPKVESYYYFPQRHTDYGNLNAGDIIDLKEAVGNDGECFWYDITERRLEFNEEVSYKNDLYYFINSYLETGTGTGIKNVTDAFSESTHNEFNLPSSLVGRILLCAVYKIGSDLTEYAPGIYYRVYVESGVTIPTLQFETTIDSDIEDDNTQWNKVANNTTTTLSTYNDDPEGEPIKRSFGLQIAITNDMGLDYDTWSIKYKEYDRYNGFIDIEPLERSNKGKPFVISQLTDEEHCSKTYIITDLIFYKGGVPIGDPYSYMDNYYQHSIEIANDIPVLFYKEKINDGIFYVIENNTTTTKDVGNNIYLQMGIMGNNLGIDVDMYALRNTPGPSNEKTWQIEYTDSKNPSVVKLSPVMYASEIFDFRNGEAHHLVGEYPYSVIKLYIYRNNEPVPTRSIHDPGIDGYVYDFSGNPYNHTIIIKDNGTTPEPDPEIDMQFAVAINNGSYKDVPNHHTTSVNKGSSVYLRISEIVKNIQYTSWQIDYTTPSGENVTSSWVDKNSPFVFNGGNPHVEKGMYVYKVNTLRLNDMGSTYSFSFSRSPYTNTIIIKDTDEPDPDPDPDPNPTVGIDISSTSGITCPDEEYVLIPYELKYSKYPLSYRVIFSAEAKAVGFTDQLESKPLPENYFTIPLPTGVPAGTYKGVIRLTSSNPEQAIFDCPFEIKVLIGTKILKQPESYSNLCAGDFFTLSVDAVGEKLNYQWYKDNQPIAGATRNVYEAAFSDETKGNYYVEVKGLCGIEKSKEVSITGNRLHILMKWDDVMYVDNTDNRYVSFQWYKDGMAIEKYGNAIYYTNTEGLMGTYFVKATTQNGTVEESCNKVFGTLTKSSTVQIYPNPVVRNESLTVSINMNETGNQKAMIHILDINGRVVLSRSLTEEQTSLPISLLTGSYVVNVQLSNGRVVSQILIVK